MTRHELRILYLLQKAGGQCRHSEISQAMARIKRAERERALAAVEELGLVSSAKLPNRPAGGFGAMVYWLTPAGVDAVEDLIERGQLEDPAARAGRRACS